MCIVYCIVSCTLTIEPICYTAPIYNPAVSARAVTLSSKYDDAIQHLIKRCTSKHIIKMLLKASN